jgi:signal peptide peptidase SppA
MKLIHAPALDQMREALAAVPQAVRDRTLPALEETPRDLAGRPSVRKAGSVAVIPITGPLYHDEGAILDEILAVFFGGTSYDTIAAGMKAALADKDVKSIVLYVNSPGGEVSGCAETAEIIKAIGRKKPVVAYASSLCASASYWLASAASEIVCDPTAIVGSIGVRASVVDDTGAMEKAGFKLFNFVARQSPHKIADPKTEKGRQQIQAQIDALGEVFVQTMAVNRNVPVAKVLSDFGGGGVLVGKEAVKVGLADSLGSLQSVVTELNRAAGTNTTGPPKKLAANASAPTPKTGIRPMNTALAARFSNVLSAVAAGKIELPTARPGQSLSSLLDECEAAISRTASRPSAERGQGFETRGQLLHELQKNWGRSPEPGSKDAQILEAHLASLQSSSEGGFKSVADRRKYILEFYGIDVAAALGETTPASPQDDMQKAIAEIESWNPDQKPSEGFASKEARRAYIKQFYGVDIQD